MAKRSKPVDIDIARAASTISHAAASFTPPAESGVFSSDDVIAAYELLLGRYPESPLAIEHYSTKQNVRDLLLGFVTSPEFISKKPVNHPFEFFASNLDAQSIIMSHENQQRQPVPGSVVNFLGVATRAGYIASLAGSKTQVERPPIPANFHAEMVEWAAALRAVDLAKGSFTMIELGAGWGYWMVNTAVAAKRRGLNVKVIGVEGDPGHIRYLKEHCAANGLSEDEFHVHPAVAGARYGTALFPKTENASEGYGQEPLFFDTRAQADNFAAEASARGRLYDAIPIVSLSGIAADIPRIDLLHIDIQGGETDLISGSLTTLNEQVAYIVVGTHSRPIDGDIVRILSEQGWILEFEKPTTIKIGEDGKPYTVLDGTQGWRNPHLTRVD